MKALFLCLVPAVLSAFGEHQENPLAPIALYTQFQQEPPPAVVDALQDEVNSIMAPAGLRFTWRVLPAARGGEASVELAVITFKGRCAVAGLARHSSNTGPLGWTHISNGVILPAGDREEAYGRALGRVVAHELYHIFANTTRHSSCGVGKSRYTARELLSSKFQFEAHESVALRTSKAHTTLEQAAFQR